MEYFLFDDQCALINIRGDILPLYDLHRDVKSRTLYDEDGWSVKLYTKNIKISPYSYRKTFLFDKDADDYHTKCYLCNESLYQKETCNCKKHYTVKQHIENCKIARKNFLSDIIFENIPEYKEKIKNISDKIIQTLLIENKSKFFSSPITHLHLYKDNEVKIKQMKRFINETIKNHTT